MENTFTSQPNQESFEQLLAWLGAVDPILSYRTAQNLY